MLTFLNNLSALAKDERGVTALEYGLIAAAVTAARGSTSSTPTSG